LRAGGRTVSRRGLRDLVRRLGDGGVPLQVPDAVAAALLTLLGASELDGGAPYAFAAVCALLLLVRRAPVPVTCAISAGTAGFLHLTAGTGLVDGQEVGVAPFWPSLLLLCAGGVLCARSAEPNWLLALPVLPCLLAPFGRYLVLGLLLGLAVGAAWRSRLVAGSAQARAEQLERLSATQRTEQIGLEERGELARELHDIVGHHVTAVVVLAEAAQAQGTGAGGELARIADTARAALAELDTLVGALREPGRRAETSAHRGIAALPELLEPMQHAGVTTALHVTVRDELSQGLQLTTYRIVQEALTNVMRHAGARTVRIGVVQQSQALEVTVEDDGVGFDSASVTRGRGLVGIGERVNGHRGTWSVALSSLGGARLAVELPLVLAISQPMATVVDPVRA